MESVYIKQLEGRYHLPRSAFAVRERLDRILRVVFDEALELALTREGISLHEQVCIRRIHVPVRLRLSATDVSLIADWSLAIAEQIHAAIENKNSEVLVRYTTRLQGLIDFATGVALGRYQRCWAWRHLGLTRTSEFESNFDAAQQLHQALMSEPEAIIPVLRFLARSQHLHLLVQRFQAQWWEDLAWRVLALSNVAPERVLTKHPIQLADAAAGTGARASAQRIVAHSLLADVLLHYTVCFIDTGVPILPYSVLIALETEPGLVFHHVEEMAILLGSILLELKRKIPVLLSHERSRLTSTAELTLENEKGAQVEDSVYETREQVTSMEVADEQGLSGMFRADDEKRQIRGAKQAHETSKEAVDEQESSGMFVRGDEKKPVPKTKPNSELSYPRASRQVIAELCSGRRPEIEDNAIPGTRHKGMTAFGGLLFTIWIVKALDLPSVIARHPLFLQRPMGWVLQHLALTLLEIEEDDVAILAFCGVQPGEVCPWQGQPRPDKREQALLSNWSKGMVQSLRDRLDWHDLSDERIIDKVCRRHARIMADPGWFEVVFSLQDISTDIRSAALDLNPGFVPWLGVVVRFIYE